MRVRLIEDGDCLLKLICVLFYVGTNEQGADMRVRLI